MSDDNFAVKRTQIRVQPSTHAKLASMLEYGDTMDRLIVRLVRKYENKE